MAFCTSCGSPTKADDIFCARCGNRVCDKSMDKIESIAHGHNEELTLGSLTASGKVDWPPYLKVDDVRRIGAICLPMDTPTGFINIFVYQTLPISLTLACYDKPLNSGGHIRKMMFITQVGSEWRLVP